MKKKIFNILAIMMGIITLAIFVLFFINKDNTYYIIMSISNISCFVFANLGMRSKNEIQKDKES